MQPALMKRLKQHITRVPETGVEVVLGVNGLVWLGPKREPGDEAPATSVRALEARDLVAL